MYPAWDERWVGGAWNEGVAYGVGVGHFQLEVQSMAKAFGWPDYAERQFYRDIGPYWFYAIQPRNQITVSIGESAGSSTYLPVHNFIRHAMLGHAYVYNDPYTQWWLNNIYVGMTPSPTRSLRPIDLLMGKRDIPEIDYRTVFPTHYLSEGVGQVNSRSSWTDTAVSVSTNCGWFSQNHADADLNQIQIYKNVTGAGPIIDGYVLGDAQIFGSSRLRDSH
jgi:hypothetical protein